MIVAISSTVKGLCACCISTFFFGSMFVPVRMHNTGDGIFVQWMIVCAIFIIGTVVNALAGFPRFYPYVMLGGFSWAIGNATAIPIIEMIGLGMGTLLWNVTNCLCGWAISRFGLFGLKANPPNNPLLNYVGLTLIIFSGILISTVKPRPKNAGEDGVMIVGMSNQRSFQGKIVDNDECRKSLMIDDRTNNVPSSSRKRIFGITLALVAGVLYGLTFVPVIYVQEKFPDAPVDSLSYVFAHFTGIFVTGTIIMVFYTIFKHNKPFINNRVILPAFATGAMWAVAQISWFVANDFIAQSISFPINSMMPGVIATLWSVTYFHEIRGNRNLSIISTAAMIALVGAVMVGLSKDF